ncbi:MAG: hypothetical protein ACT4SY_10195 [Hyphomicrobiales bacterium]
MPILPYIRIVLGVGVLLLAAGPWLFGTGELKLLTAFFCLLVLALMWNLLAGYADIVTVGQHAFVGVGAYWPPSRPRKTPAARKSPAPSISRSFAQREDP